MQPTCHMSPVGARRMWPRYADETERLLVKELVPLLQTLVWPVGLALLLWRNKEAFVRIVTALAKRIEDGAPLKAGAVEIGAAPSLPSVPKETDPRQVDALPHDIYMVHSALRDRALDTAEYEYYRLRIFLESDEPQALDDVASVTYRLHPTFRDPVRMVSDRKSNFELRTAAWGEFNMTAEIAYRGGKKLVVERYINLPGVTA